MDETRPAMRVPNPREGGPLTRDEALALLERAGELLASGDFGSAGEHFARVVGFDDPAITAAALLGLGEVRFRLDQESAAVETWSAVLRLGETPSTYSAWRNLAAARVRGGDLRGAIEAYREADRRAPREDKAEIATRLGWLTKETGDPRTARRYFAAGRGDTSLLTVTLVIIGITCVVSLTALLSADGQSIYSALWLDKRALAAGEYWRLWTVTLLHGDLLHLLFNMYALFLAGPVVERWYGRGRFLLFYLLLAAAGSTGSFVFGGDVPAVGASGAIFGLFGMLLSAGRLHHPVDRQSRALVGQVGILILLNLVFGLASGGSIDNFAHIGGLVAGIWLGAVIVPTGVPTLSSLWQRPGQPTGPAQRAGNSPILELVGVIVVVAVVAAGVAVGTAERTGGVGARSRPSTAPVAIVSERSAPSAARR
jgi:membrane associated rhomboid family serine protease